MDKSDNKLAVAYARVSSKEQEKEGYSVPAQTKLLKEYAAKLGIRIVKIFTDSETAKRAGRTGFGEMLEYVRTNKDVKKLLVEKTDRLYRNIKDWVTVDELNLQIHLIKENVILSDESRSHEKFVHGIKVVVAKHFIDNLSEETKKGMYEKAEEGILPTKAPFGYINMKAPDNERIIAIDTKTAPIVKKIFELYSTGNYSLEQLSDHLRKDGIVLRKSKIERILKNPIYHGYFYWGGTIYKGTHEPLLSKDLWDIVQDVLKKRGKTSSKPNKHRWAFQGVLRCGHCGCLLTAEKRKGKYVYYHCTGQRGKCQEPYVREEVLDQQFKDYLEAMTIDEATYQWLKKMLNLSQKSEREELKKQSQDLDNKYYALKRRISKLYDDKVDGHVDDDFYKIKYEEWKAELDNLELSRSAHKQRIDGFEDDICQQVLELVKSAYNLYQEQDAEERRKLIGFIFSNPTFKEGKIQPDFRKPFDSLINTNIAYQKKKAVDGEIHDLRPVWGALCDNYRIYYS